MRNKLAHTLEKASISITNEIADILSKKTIVPNEGFYWKELVACNIGSRTRAEVAHAAMETLTIGNHLRVPFIEMPMKHYQIRIQNALSVPLFLNSDKSGTSYRYPFPKQKARYIAECARNIYCSSSLTELIHSYNDWTELRKHVCSTCLGIGPKQASLFMRNAGVCKEVAVLDTHILDYMQILRLPHADGKPPTTIKSYEKSEKVFSRYATKLGFDVWVLDMAIWFVMRVYKRSSSI